MESQELKDCINRIEQAADEAKQACQSSQPPQALKDSVEQLHQRAREAKASASSQADESSLRQPVVQLEQAADRAMQACRTAGGSDRQMQQAIQKAHDEASKLKKQMEGRPSA
jgi:hypothetical protein